MKPCKKKRFYHGNVFMIIALSLLVAIPISIGAILTGVQSEDTEINKDFYNKAYIAESIMEDYKCPQENIHLKYNTVTSDHIYLTALVCGERQEYKCAKHDDGYVFSCSKDDNRKTPNPPKDGQCPYCLGVINRNNHGN